MLIDLHMHECTYSKDSVLTLETIVKTARLKGLDGVCITDHDSMGLRSQAEAYSRKVDFPIFVGVEHYSLQGDIVAFGLDKAPDHRMEAQAFIDLVKSQGGVCFAAHPFRNNNRGLEELLAQVRGLDGIEAFNASASPEANLRALEYCRRLHLQPVGVSDCHVEEKIGHYATFLPGEARSLKEFMELFRKGHCYPVAYGEEGYRPLIKPSVPSHNRITA